MFAEKLNQIIQRQDPLLWAKTYHRLAKQLVANDELMYLLHHTGVDISKLECGFCPCGKDLIVIAVDKPNDWTPPTYQAAIHCPTCQKQFELGFRETELSTSVRAGDLEVYCQNRFDKQVYQMVVRPVYLWQMESSLTNFARVI